MAGKLVKVAGFFAGIASWVVSKILGVNIDKAT